MKEKIRSYDFWMAVASALFVVLQAVGFTTEIPYLREITTAFLGILAVSGFIVKPPGKESEKTSEGDQAQADEEKETCGEVSEIIDKIIDNTK